MKPDTLAFDLDGTLSHKGRTKDALVDRLRALRKDFRLILITSRCRKELERVIPTDPFHVVAYEGGCFVEQDGITFERLPDGWDKERNVFLKEVRSRGIVPGTCEEAIISFASGDVEKLPPLSDTMRLELNLDRAMVQPSARDKGETLLYCVARLGSSRVAVFGNGENDLAMFRVAQVRIALANSVDSLKAIADYTATAEDGEGVMEALRNYFGIKTL
jgi:hydroxymethylpyrimidine pyrophosphatase-like HAD family hydrolase